MNVKVCKSCGIEKPLSDFYKNKKWYQSKCKECFKRVDCDKCKYKAENEKLMVTLRKSLLETKRLKKLVGG